MPALSIPLGFAMRVKRTAVMAVLFVMFSAGAALAQERLTDQVAVAVLRNQVYAATPGEGLVRQELSAGERVLDVQSRGINALVRTSLRLLGFSGVVKRWEGRRLDLHDEFRESLVTPRLVLVRTAKHLYGFQGPAGRWKVEELSSQEKFDRLRSGENIAVVLTDRRALAFSTFTGGFFSQDISRDEPVIQVEINDNVAVLHTASRRFIFRSGLAVWAELR